MTTNNPITITKACIATAGTASERIENGLLEIKQTPFRLKI